MLAFKEESAFLKGQVFFVKELVLPLWSRLQEVCLGLAGEEQARLEKNLAQLQEAL